MGVTTALAGGTGLVGASILAVLAQHPEISSIHALGRRSLPSPHDASTSKLHSLINADSSQWANQLSTSLGAKPQSGNTIFFSALGTTRAQAGGLAAQRKVDHDLPLSLATAFANRDTPTAERSVFVLISSAGANPHALLAYPKMKGETEEAVKALLKGAPGQEERGLDHVVILRPGLLVGTRRESDSRPAEFMVRKIAGFAGARLGGWAKDFWAQDVEVVAKAAVNAALQCAQGKRVDKVWVLDQAEIMSLGRA